MKNKILSYVMAFFILFQNGATVYWASVMVGGLMSLSSYSFAEYNPSLPPTTTPAPDDSDGDGQVGPFDFTQEAINIGVGATQMGLPTADSSGTNLTYTDHTGAPISWDMDDTASGNGMFPAAYNDSTSYSVSNLKNAYGDSSQIQGMVNAQRVQVDAEDPNLNTSIMGMMVRDMDTQAEEDIYHDMREDPLITQAAEIDRSVSEVFTNVFTDCNAISLPGTTDGATTEVDCYRPSGSLPNSCTLRNEVIITPIGGATAVSLIIDDSGSMGQSSNPNSRMSRAILASLVIATAMDDAVNTEFYARSFKDDPVQDWNDTVSTSANAYNSINGGGSTPLGAVMAQMAPIMNARPEPNKIVIVVSDGAPDSGPAVDAVLANNPNITWYGIGIELNSIQNYAFDATEVVNSNVVDVAIFNILSNNFTLTNQWVGDECLNVAQLHSLGVVNASASCTTPPNALGCVFIDTLWVCPTTSWAASLNPTPYPAQVPSLCGAITVSGITYSNSNCWVDENGDNHCVGDVGLNTCDAYVNNSSWGIETSSCVPGAIDSNSGECILFGETYLGGYGSASNAVLTPLPAADCGGPVHCADGSCYAPPEEVNPNFSETATYIHTVMTAAMDQDCDISNPETCVIFGGEGESCHKNGDLYNKRLGINYNIIAVNCCEDSMSIGMTEYLALAELVYRQEKTQQYLTALNDWAVETYSTASNAISNTDAFKYVKGAATSLYDNVTNSELWKTITKPFVSSAECTVANTSPSALESVSTGVTDSVAAIQSVFMNYTGELIRKITWNGIGEALVGSESAAILNGTMNGLGKGSSSGILGTTTSTTITTTSPTGFVTTSTTTTTTFGPVANFFGPIMMAYMIYNLVVLAANLIDGCVQEEFEFNTKRELGACTGIYDYCTTWEIDPNISMTFPTQDLCVREEKRGCCFGSPLSRIINEQAKLQGVTSLGYNGVNAACGGLTISQLGSLDWELVDLTEWTKILAVTDKIPESAYKDSSLPVSPYDASTEFSMEHSTGQNGMSSMNALTRAQEYISFDIDDVREATNKSYMSGANNDIYVPIPN